MSVILSYHICRSQCKYNFEARLRDLEVIYNHRSFCYFLFNLQISKIFRADPFGNLRPETLDKHLMTMFSQMRQVCSTLFWLSYRILIHAGSMPLYLSQSLVLLTPLSWEIQLQSRIAHTCLILNSSCHDGHLNIRWF